MSDISFDAGIAWWQVLGGLLTITGVATFWRGLIGGAGGKQGLLRRQAGTLGRIEGWRIAIFGLALAGGGIAWLFAARWLLFLSLGIGFCEVQEASMVISAWKAAPHAKPRT